MKQMYKELCFSGNNDVVVKELKYCPYGTCVQARFYEKDPRTGERYLNCVMLMSYSTHVATYWADSDRIDIKGLYSMTTRKHIRAFVNEMQELTESCSVPHFYRIPFEEIKIVAMSKSHTWLDLKERKAVFVG